MAAQFPNVYERAAQRQAEEAALIQAQQAEAAAEAERTRSRTLGETGRDVALSLSAGIGGLVGAGYGLANVATGGTLDRATGGAGTQFFQDWQAAMAEGRSAPLRAQQEAVSGAFQESVGAGLLEAATTPSVLADMAIQSLPYFVPGLGAAGAAARVTQAGALARGATEAAAGLAAGTNATRAALAANAATMGGAGNVDAINEARAAGLGENDVQLAGLGGFAANALLSYGTNRLTGAAALEAGVAQRVAGAGALGPGGGVAAQIGLGALREGAQEAVEEAGQTAIRNLAGQRDVGEGVVESAALGGLLGGTFGGVFGAANVRKPTQTREQIAAVHAELEAELAELGLSTGPRPLDSIMRTRQRAGELQAQIDANPEIQAALGRQALPDVRYVAPEEIDIGATPVPGAEFDAEEINLGVAPPPGLTGLNAIVAQQRARQAQQPPRMGVQEISFDQFAPAPEQEVAGLPQVDEITGRSVQDIIRETAPISRVAQQFGPAVAGAEAARRTSVAGIPVAPAQALDLSTPRARGEFKASVRQAFVAQAGITPRQAQGAQFEAIVDAAAQTGAVPGTPEFDAVVGVEAARRLGQVEAAGGQSTLLGALVNNYPVTEEQRVGAAFERGGIATTEEELFGAAPAPRKPAAPTFIDTPAAQVETVERGQEWVSPTGEVHTVSSLFNGRPQLQTPRGNRVTKTKAALEREGWSLRQSVEQAVARAAPKPGKDLTAKEQIAALGGINVSYRQDITGDTVALTSEAAPGRGRVFTRDGTSPGDMALQLVERDYIPADEVARDGGVSWLYAAVNRVLAGEQIYPIGSAAEQRQIEAGLEQQAADRRAAETQQEPQQAADATTPRQVTADAPRYDAQAWADYMTYPGAAQLNALVDMKGQEGHPQPVLAAMLFGIDIAGDLAELGPLANAAQAHPEFALMSQASRSEVTTHIAQAVNRITGATFELADTVPVRSTELQRALALSEDEYITAINPAGATSEAGDVVIVRVGDLERPRSSTKIATFADNTGAAVAVYADEVGTLYAEQGGEIVGQIESRDGETLNIVAQEVQGRGIGTGLAAELIKRDPFAQAGSLSPAGEATRRAAFRRVKAQTAKFAQGTAPKSMNKRVFDRAIVTAQGNLTVPVSGFDTVADLQAATGLPLPVNTKGMFYQGNIYLVRENIANGKDMALTLAHELGHSGLSSLLGTSLNAATNRMWANADMRKRIRAKMVDLKMAQGTEAERRASRTLAAEEVLADMLAANERLNKDIWSKLRAGVRDFFARVFGVRDYVVSNKEVDALLGDVARVINGASAAQVHGDLANADVWLNTPEQAAESNPKFSKVKADLDAMVTAAQNEPNARVLPMHDIAKAAGEASIDAARSVAGSLRNNKPGELYISNAMHLNQLSDWFDKLFKGRIGKLAALKRGKEAFFNQQNSRPFSMEYEGSAVGTQSVNDVAKDWAKFGRQNPQKFNALNNMMQYSTFYKVFPDRPWDKQNDIDYEAAGYTEEQRMAAHAQMAALYKSVGADGQALYKKSQAIYETRWKSRFDALIAELDRIGKVHKAEVQQEDGTTEIITKYKADIRRAMQRISEGPYSPLQRNGEHLVVARNAAGEVVHFSAYDTREEAEITRKTVAERLRQEGEESGAVTVSRQKDFNMMVDGVSRGTIESLTRNVRADIEGALPADMDTASRNQVLNALSSGLTEAYLQALPQNAFMKHARQRRNVEGFDTDAFRAFADYTLRSARDIANIKFDGQIGSALNDIQKYVDDVTAGRIREPGQEGVVELDTTKLQNVADAVKNQHAASLEVVNNNAVNALSQGAFVYFMTSPSQMFLNATQTYMVAFPRLAGIYGAGRAIRELNRAAGQYFKSKFDLLSPTSVINENAKTDASEAYVADMLRTLYEDGTLDFTQAHDLAELSGGRNTALTPYMSKAMEVMSYAMHKSEVFNRQVTAAATARLELDKMRRENTPLPRRGTPEYTVLQQRLADVGRRAIDTTHFDYSQSNKPALMQGPIGKLAFQFQQYRFHMLSMIGKDLRDAELGKLATLRPPANPQEARVARETLAWLLGMQLAFVGTAGTILAPFVFGLADAFKDDDDLTASRQDWINAVGKYAAHGVLAGVVDTQRIAADTLIPYLGGKAYEPIGGKPSETLLYHISQNLGPWVGLLGDAFDGSAALMNGDVYKASQDLLPKPFRDVTKSLYEGVNGARDARDIVYNEPSVLSGVTGFLGLRSAERRDVEAGRSAVYRANKTAFDLKDRYLTRMAAAYTNGDRDAIAEAQSDIQAWNQRYPDFAIRAQDMARAVTSRVRAQQVAEQTGVVSSRLPGPTIDAVLGR